VPRKYLKIKNLAVGFTYKKSNKKKGWLSKGHPLHSEIKTNLTFYFTNNPAIALTSAMLNVSSKAPVAASVEYPKLVMFTPP
jgi:hypothetical protein